MKLVKINNIELKEYNHGRYIQYGFHKLTSYEVNEIYLELCDKYNRIDKFFNKSIFHDEVSGYFKCSN